MGVGERVGEDEGEFETATVGRAAVTDRGGVILLKYMYSETCGLRSFYSLYFRSRWRVRHIITYSGSVGHEETPVFN